MMTPYGPLPGAFEPTPDAATARDLYWKVGEAFLGIEDDGAAARRSYRSSAPPLAWMIAGHPGELKPDTTTHGCKSGILSMHP